LVSSKRFGPYLSQDDHGRPYIDRAKVRRAEQLDGKFVLTTNDDTLSAADIALGYKGMWIIEACFRRLKTTGLAIRPMFHWTPRRIVAHVKLCVLALMIQRAAEIAAGAPWSQLADVLERLKAVRYTSLPKSRPFTTNRKLGSDECGRFHAARLLCLRLGAGQSGATLDPGIPETGPFSSGPRAYGLEGPAMSRAPLFMFATPDHSQSGRFKELQRINDDSPPARCRSGSRRSLCDQSWIK
jgi:hypothetical protein